jgi:hypothetical membrane protein
VKNKALLNATGVIGPVLWAAAVIYCGAIRPSYDPVRQFISELAERGSSTEYLMRVAGFCLPGLLAAVYGISLLGIQPSSAVALLIIASGLARFIAGVFPCDAGCPTVNPSFSQVIHNIAALVGALALLLAALFCFLRPEDLGASRPFAWYSIASFLIGLTFWVLLMINTPARHAVGLLQRVAVGALNLWVAVLAAVTWRRLERARSLQIG